MAQIKGVKVSKDDLPRALVGSRPEGYVFNITKNISGDGTATVAGYISQFGNIIFKFPAKLIMMAINVVYDYSSGQQTIIPPGYCTINLFNSPTGAGNPGFDLMSELCTPGLFQAFDSNNLTFNGNDSYKDMSGLGLIYSGINGLIVISDGFNTLTVADTARVNITMKFERV